MNTKKHQCTGKEENGWIVFTCNECSFVRRINIATGQTKSSLNGSDPYALHEGFYMPVDVQQIISN